LLSLYTPLGNVAIIIAFPFRSYTFPHSISSRPFLCSPRLGVHISLLLLRPHRLAVYLSVAVTKTLTLSWLAQVVAAELEDSNLRAAVRILCSEDSQAQPSLDADLAKLHAMQLCDALTSHH